MGIMDITRKKKGHPAGESDDVGRNQKTPETWIAGIEQP